MMQSDSILHQTFVEHEWLVPDTEHAQAAFYRHLRARRRRRTRQSLAAVVAAVAAGAVTVGVTQLAGSAPGRATGDPGTVAGVAAPGTPRADPRAAVQVGLPTTLTLGAGWLPGATTEVVDGNGFGAQKRGFLMNGGGPHSYVLITAEPGGLTSPYGGTPHDRRISGKPAREFLQAGVYYVAVQVAPGRILSVYVGDDAGAEELAVIGRRVAENLRLDRHDTIRLRFGLTYVPAGTGVRGFERDTVASSTELRIGTERTRTAVEAPYTVMEAAGADGGSLPAGAKSGRTVQGHPTRYASSGDTAYLWVDGYLGDSSVLLTGRVGSRTELYKIADGLRRH
jgi:hypothetical protein